MFYKILDFLSNNFLIEKILIFLFKIYDIILYRFHPKHRYHVLNLGFKPRYMDVSERLIYANFQLLKEFIEREKPFDIVDYDSEPDYSHVGKELKSLYHWWIYERPNRKNPLDYVGRPKTEIRTDPKTGSLKFINLGTEEENIAWNIATNEYHRLLEEWSKEDTENIKRLAEIREYLWT